MAGRKDKKATMKALDIDADAVWEECPHCTMVHYAKMKDNMAVQEHEKAMGVFIPVVILLK